MELPKPHLAFRVGVVGHRPNRLQEADLPGLSDVLHKILATVKSAVIEFGESHPRLFAEGAPTLRAVSPLAEGTDRLFASEALKLGFDLCCVMPFPMEEFEKDFTAADSREQFRALLTRGRETGKLTVFELAGSRADEALAYQAGGRVVRNQSDLLIVVWDGRREGKKGGTEDTLDEARQRGVNVIFVSAAAPHHWQIVEPHDSLSAGADGRCHPAGDENLDRIKTLVLKNLELPDEEEADPDHQPPLTIESFFSEQQRHRSLLGSLWKCFRDLIAHGKLSLPKTKVPDYELAIESDWPKNQSTEIARVVDRLRPFYAWPDQLAVYYSNIYRSVFVFANLLGAAAVVSALLPLMKHIHGHEPSQNWQVGSAVAEFAIISVMLVLIWLGRQRRWHERWLEFRLVAECVRHLRLVAPLGGERPFPQPLPYVATYGNPAATWVGWYVRALERDLGLPNARLDGPHLRQSLEHLTALLNEQIQYHEDTADRCHNLENRLEFVRAGLLGLTLVVCAVHFFLHEESPALWLTALSGIFPALGAALAGIINQGEFRRIAKRSTGMAAHLKKLQEDVIAARDLLPNPGQPAPGQAEKLYYVSMKARELATKTAHLMINEVLDWRVVFLDRPLVAS